MLQSGNALRFGAGEAAASFRFSPPEEEKSEVFELFQLLPAAAKRASDDRRRGDPSVAVALESGEVITDDSEFNEVFWRANVQGTSR